MKKYVLMVLFVLVSIQNLECMKRGRDGSTPEGACGGGSAGSGAAHVMQAGVAPLKKIQVAPGVGAGAGSLSLPERLKDLGEDQGLGYKTANLIVLKEMCTGFADRFSALNVGVPEFVGIPSQKMIEALSAIKFDVAKEWSNVVATMAADAAIATSFTPEFLAARMAFEANLTRSLDTWIHNVTKSSFALIGLPDLHRLITEVSARQGRLMIRSTGKEDTEENANAGGNETVANVEPSVPAVLAAMKRVIISYFSEISLSQRLGGGDRTVFDSNVFMPVLIQEMVGEVAGQEVPRCGVLFTQDPESRANGIAIFQTSWGHNEGVVNSTVVVDTFYAVRSADGKFAMHPIIRRKDSRLVPQVGEEGLKRVTNAEESAQSSTLNKFEMGVVAQVGYELEQQYGYALDIEFVIKNKTLYIVQARPIVHDKKVVEPSYIAYPKIMPGQKFFGKSIGTAGGYVREIENKDQMLCGQTLADVMAQYQNPLLDRSKIRAVIVGEMVASTAHGSTVLRGAGKPLLYLPAWEQVKKLVAEGKKLVIDTQRGCAWACEGGTNLDALKSAGWYLYPMSAQLSVLPWMLPVKSKEILSSALKPMRRAQAISFLDAMQNGSRDLPLGDGSMVLDNEVSAIRHADKPDVARKAGHALMKKFVNIIRAYRSVMEFDADLDSDADFILVALAQTIQRIVDSCGDESRHMEFLLNMRALEALFRQEGDDIARPLSVKSLLTRLKQERALQVETPVSSAGISGYYLQLLKVKDVIFVPALKEQWDTALKLAARDEKTIKRLATFVAKLTRFDVLPTWLHTTFAAESDLSSDYLSPLITQWEKPLIDGAAFLEQLSIKRAFLKSVNLAVFSASEKFDAAWVMFDNEVIKYLEAAAFVEAFRGTSPLVRSIACQVIGDAVDTLDLMIKSMKGSSMADRPKRFQQMLKRYRDIFDAIVALVPDGAINYGPTPLKLYQEMIGLVVDKEEFTEDDLNATPSFNVPSFTIGSGMNLLASRMALPQRGEDIFSVIHQCLVVALSAIGEKEVCIIPEKVQLIKDILAPASGISKQFSPRASCLSTRFSAKGVLVHCNLPQRNHSCQFFINYDGKTEQTDLTVQFYGHSPERWAYVGSLAVLLGCTGVCKEKNFILDDGVSFTLQIEEWRQLSLISQMLQKCYEFALYEGDRRDMGVFFKALPQTITKTDVDVRLKAALKDKVPQPCDWANDPRIYARYNMSDEEMMTCLKGCDYVFFSGLCDALIESHKKSDILVRYTVDLGKSKLFIRSSSLQASYLIDAEQGLEVFFENIIDFIKSPDSFDEKYIERLVSTFLDCEKEKFIEKICDFVRSDHCYYGLFEKFLDFFKLCRMCATKKDQAAYSELLEKIKLIKI